MNNVKILVRCVSCEYTVVKDSKILDYINKLNKFRCRQCRHFGATIFITQDERSSYRFMDEQTQRKQSLQSEIMALAKRKDALQSKIRNRLNKKGYLEDEIEVLNGKYASLRSQKQALDRQVSELEATVEQLTTEPIKVAELKKQPEEIEQGSALL